MTCISEYDTCIIRGTTYALTVGLSAAYTEVTGNLTQYQVVMSLRESQDDDLTPYLTVVGTPTLNPDPLPNEPAVLYDFFITPTQSQALPDWDIVGFVELSSLVDTNYISRLFNMNIEVQD